MSSYRPMKHLNGNILCVVDVETTGVDPARHDIIEVAALPLLDNLEINTNRLPFEMYLRPRRPENIDEEALKITGMPHDMPEIEKVAKRKRRVVEICLNGHDPYDAAELFVQWFEGFNLPFRKKLIPIAHNWPFDREFLKDWLGQKTFENIFHPLYRDTMGMSLFENDIASYRGYPFPYNKNNLAYLCTTLNIPRTNGHEALADCVNTAAVYKRIVQQAAFREAQYKPGSDTVTEPSDNVLKVE